MKTELSTSKVILLAFISLSLNLSYHSAKAQTASQSKKVDQKSLDSIASLNYIVKYKIKAVTTHTYDSDDSTLSNAKLSSKEKTIYDREGNMLESIRENGTGKTIQKTVSKLDSRKNLTEYTVYDSTNRVSYLEKRFYDNLDRLTEYTTYDTANKLVSSEKRRYDDLNRLIESSSTMPLYMYSYRQEDKDNDKTCTYTYRSKYDLNDNLIEYITDSSGVIINKTVSKFDAKNRPVYSENYDHNLLQSTEAYVYDKKGGFTQTVEYYWTASKTQCSPNKNRTVTKYDAKGNSIQSINTSDENGATSITKTTSDYKYYDEFRLSSLKTTTETKAEGYNSKSVTSYAYKYDKKGNEIEAVTKYGGSGSSTYTTISEYNSNNEMTRYTVYNGTCMDKPTSVALYIYHPDGKTVKEAIYESFDYPTKSIDKFDSRSIPVEHISTTSNNASRTVYNYEY